MSFFMKIIKKKGYYRFLSNLDDNHILHLLEVHLHLAAADVPINDFLQGLTLVREATYTVKKVLLNFALCD